MTAHVVIPAASWDDQVRLAARDWIVRWWTSRGYPVTVAALDTPPWSKGAAANSAIREACTSSDVVIVADADVWTHTDNIEHAVRLAAGGQWCAPFTTVRRLDRQSTAEVLAADPALTERPPYRNLAQPPHDVLPGGGIIAAHRNLWGAVGGFDPRFRGWGGEDYALGCALRTLADRPLICGGNLWHLWHTPQPDCRASSPDTDALGWRYRKAKFKPHQMRALIGEWR